MHIFFLTVQLIFSTLSAREATCSVQGPSAPHTGNIVICGKEITHKVCSFFFPSSFQTANQKIRLNVCFCRKTEDNRQKTGGRRGGEDEGGEGRGVEGSSRTQEDQNFTAEARWRYTSETKQRTDENTERGGGRRNPGKQEIKSSRVCRRCRSSSLSEGGHIPWTPCTHWRGRRTSASLPEYNEDIII